MFFFPMHVLYAKTGNEDRLQYMFHFYLFFTLRRCASHGVTLTSANRIICSLGSQGTQCCCPHLLIVLLLNFLSNTVIAFTSRAICRQFNSICTSCFSHSWAQSKGKQLLYFFLYP